MIEPTISSPDRNLTEYPERREVGDLSRHGAVAQYPSFERPFSRISWGSVVAGAIIALATQIVLTLIGGAVGLATLNPSTGNSPSGAALGSGAAIWLVVSSLVALFIGGFISARLAGRFNGWLHGLTTWATLTLLTLVLLTTAGGQLIGAASGLTNFAVNNNAKLQSLLPSSVQSQVSQAADQTSARVQSTDPATRDAQARDIEQKTATRGAVGAGAAALAMILGALAAAFGGKLGESNPRRDSSHLDHSHTASRDHADRVRA